MNKKLSKIIAKTLCITTLFTASISAPVFAASSTNYQTSDIKVSKVKSGNAYIPEGTIVQIEVEKTISSKDVKQGDYIPMHLVSNLIINDVVVAPAGTEVKCFVSEQRKANAFGRGGKLEIRIVSFKSTNDVEIPLEFSELMQGKKVSGGVVDGATISVVGGFLIKGKNVRIDEGTKFDAEVSSDTDLNISIENLPSIEKYQYKN